MWCFRNCFVKWSCWRTLSLNIQWRNPTFKPWSAALRIMLFRALNIHREASKHGSATLAAANWEEARTKKNYFCVILWIIQSWRRFSMSRFRHKMRISVWENSSRAAHAGVFAFKLEYMERLGSSLKQIKTLIGWTLNINLRTNGEKKVLITLRSMRSCPGQLFSVLR